MDNLNNSLGKVSIGVPVSPFLTFVPMVWKLPIESILTDEDTSGALTEKNNQNFTVSHEETTRDGMTDRQISNVETVFIKEAAEGGARSTIQPETQVQLKPDHVSPSQSKASPPASAWSENTPNHVAAVCTASMETAVDKHRGISLQQQRRCCDTSGLAEVSSGFFPVNRACPSQGRMSPADSADLQFPTPASSRESILSEGWDRELRLCWSAVPGLSSVTSPLSFSRTVSPCSSVRSGFLTPAVVQIKRHFLAPGSSLAQTPPQTRFSSCDSLSSSLGPPQSPPPPARHRPPLTRLSLLTAILRKGRLPILSSALHRPYTPCWPVNPITLSFCNACSAASSLASIPLEFSSRCSSSASIDSQSRIHREPHRCVTSPPPVQPNKFSQSYPQQPRVKRDSEQIGSSSTPRWEQVISPHQTVKSSGALLHAPPPLFCPNLQSISPKPKHENIDYAAPERQRQHTNFLKSPELTPINTHHKHLRSHTDNLKKPVSPSPKLINERETCVPQKWSGPPVPHSSLSGLHSLSRQMRSPPLACLPQPSPSRSPISTRTTAPHTVSPPPPSHNNFAGRCEPDSKKSATTQSEGFLKAHCLSPSRYTPMAFPGWPSPYSSPTPTPSPAPPCRDLTPSPSLLTPRSTPSPRPGSGISDCSDGEGKKRKTHKIKLNYKSLAAIPTNTLLLDQQAIDEQVESGQSLCDTHAEMRSPAQLRQQSEELYAVIDEILAGSNPAPSRSLTSNVGVKQNNSSLSKSLGRETKYASLSSLLPSISLERNLMDPKKTRPGVIRPMTAIPRLTVEDEEEFYQNPFRQIHDEHTSADNRKVENKSLEEAGKDLDTSSRDPALREEKARERITPFSVCDLQIAEPQDLISHPVKDASTSFSCTAGRMDTYETHI